MSSFSLIKYINYTNHYLTWRLSIGKRKLPELSDICELWDNAPAGNFENNMKS